MARVNAPDPLAITALVHIHIGPKLTLFTAPAPTCGQHRELCPALPALSGHAALDAARLAGDLSAGALPSRALGAQRPPPRPPRSSRGGRSSSRR